MRKRSFLKAVAGFTLIELIAVMALMAIAAAIAVPIIINYNEEKRKDIYAETCAYVLDSAVAITDSIAKGNDNILGKNIKTIAGVQDLLNENNEFAYKFTIKVTNNKQNPSIVQDTSKDCVVVYFLYNNTKTEARAVGAWYVLKGESSPRVKYDTAKGIDLYNKEEGKFTDFTTPVFEKT